MSKSNKLLTGHDLGLAICKHFGIDTKRHSVDSVFQIKTEPGQLAAVSLTLFMSPEDLAGIARAAGASERATFLGSGYYPGGLALVGEEGPELINFADPNTAPEHTPDTATLTNKVDADEVNEILRRWDAGGQAPDDSKMMDAINQLVEETRKMRECLYRIMKNTERSAWLADAAAATSSAALRG